jgi:hypothetical protein
MEDRCVSGLWHYVSEYSRHLLSEYKNESNENCDCWQQGGGHVEFLKKDNSFNSKTQGFGVWTMQVVIIAPWLKY